MSSAYPLLEFWLRSDASDDSTTSRGNGTRRADRVRPIPNDTALVERLRAGDESALGILYEANFHDLWVFARRYVGEALAEEVVQDVFLWAWTHRTWTIKTTFRAYLFGAIRHRALNVVHRDAIETRAAELIQRDATELYRREDDVSGTAARAELRLAVARTVAALPERQRAAIILRIDRGLSYAEIGESLGISATAAGNLVKKGEEKLRTALRVHREG
jgi:RNA polymerase sigma-70 factor (ECF subfamily)